MALVGGIAGFSPVYVMGLGVPMFIVWPLALLAGSMLATLSAGWVANLSASGALAHTKSRLRAIFAVSVAASLVGLFAGFAGAFLVNEFGIGTNFNADLIVVYLPGAIIFAGATAVATWRLRIPATDRLEFAGKAALVLAVAWLVLLVVVVGPGYSLLSGLPGLGAGSEIMVLLSGSFVLTALGAFLAARYARGAAGHGLQWDAALSLMVIGLTPAVIIGAISLGCSVSSCIP